MGFTTFFMWDDFTGFAPYYYCVGVAPNFWGRGVGVGGCRWLIVGRLGLRGVREKRGVIGFLGWGDIASCEGCCLCGRVGGSAFEILTMGGGGDFLKGGKAGR